MISWRFGNFMFLTMGTGVFIGASVSANMSSSSSSKRPVAFTGTFGPIVVAGGRGSILPPFRTMLTSKELNTTDLILKMTKPADPADQWIEDGLLGLIRASRSPFHPASRRRLSSALHQVTPLSPLYCPPTPTMMQTVRERMEASFSISRCIVRFMIHFIKGMAVGTGMYATDYFLVNGQFERLFDMARQFFSGDDSANDIRLIP